MNISDVKTMKIKKRFKLFYCFFSAGIGGNSSLKLMCKSNHYFVITGSCYDNEKIFDSWRYFTFLSRLPGWVNDIEKVFDLMINMGRVMVKS